MVRVVFLAVLLAFVFIGVIRLAEWFKFSLTFSVFNRSVR